MELKYWEKEKDDDGPGICLGRVLLIIKLTDSQKVRIKERCDSWFFKDYTQEEAIELLEEATNFVKGLRFKNSSE